MVTDQYNTLYLSPHLDDVVLSCGGQIYQQCKAGERVLIVTLTAGEPQTNSFSIFAQFQHHSWGLEAGEVLKTRRAEDKAACRRLGATCLQWTVPDAIYRFDAEAGEALYDSDTAIFGPLHEAEKSLVTDVAAKMGSLPPAGRVVAPLGLGNHVDHQLTRAAAEQVFGPDRLAYYEDYPYAQRHPETLAELLQPTHDWLPLLITVDEATLRARIEAIRAYRSQIGMLFNDEANMVDKVRAYVEKVGGERLWIRRA